MRGARVLDASTTLAGAYCTRLFATAGADVVVAEPPGGSPLRNAPPWLSSNQSPDGSNGTPRSAVWEYLAAYKRGIVVDPDGPDFAALAASFDLVVLSADGNPDEVSARAERLRAANPAAVIAVLSGFGLTGRYRGYRSTPLTDWAAGGHLAITGEPTRQPIAGGGPWVTYLVGATAAVGAQAALLRARRTRQGDLLDVGAMEAAAACHQWSTVLYTHSGVLKQRWGNRLGEAHHPMNLYRCSDGWVVIGAVSREQWEGLCIAMDGVEFLAEEALYVPAIRFDRSEEIDAIIDPWCAGLTTAEVVTALQENRCPAARVLTLQETLRDPQLEARGFWVTAEQAAKNTKMPGVPFRIGGYETPFRPAPALGEHQNEVVA